MSEADEQQIATAQQQVLRGDNARRLLEEPLLVEAFEAVHDDLQAKMFNTLPSQSAERETLYLCALMLKRVRAEIEHHVTTGNMAKATLAERAGRVVRRFADPIRKRTAS
jgi:hypothetical protein